MTQFPITRMRRLRKHPALRRMVRETYLSPRDFIYPVFICPGSNINKPVGSMPGVAQWSIDHLTREAPLIAKEGVPAIILFGIPEKKDDIGAISWSDDGIIQQALKALKAETPELLAIVDLCFCEYTSHGHCGVMRDTLNGGKDLDNDATLKNLAKQAVSLAAAGADVIAPSGMIDGMVKGIREGLDGNGFSELPILSYAAKYASSYYGPFRDAAESAPAFGDRRSHQMDPGNANEALREVAIDLEEGADMVMVKPAMPYLDIIRRVKDRFGVPTAAYQVSGEYSMILAAANNGWIDRQKMILESLTCIKRAGADMILTYFAREAAQLLRR
ncbi:MAG: delta-aminolevulinic acid dehydratase [Deltaproteobacteria bacterium RIFOXYA12_FULL_58_15]|nr:MAG: delta-aminolevulinic acid dehydratase [Deltaproteobacteria bacterium RIFOXYA12_FULL_58_15]